MSRTTDPVFKLRGEARAIAQALKARDPRMVGPGGQVFRKSDLTFAIAMDDKFLKIETTWKAIDESSTHELTEFILREMRRPKEMQQ